jgi:acetylglutamate kinase
MSKFIQTKPQPTVQKTSDVLNTIAQSVPKSNDIVVIKIGGSTLTSEQAMLSLLTEVAILSETGAKVVLVHGGGPAISEAIAATGEKPHFVEGLRVTNDSVLSIAQKVLDELNEKLVAGLNKLGVKATSINSKTQEMFTAKKKTITCSSGAKLDIGWVGEIGSVNKENLLSVLNDSLPVVASLAHDESGQLYNVNADNIAMAVAVGLSADKLVYITDVPGILMEKEHVIPTISLDEISVLIESGIISGGMIPKVRNCASGIKKGIGSVLIASAENEGDLLSAILKPGSSGTMIVAETLIAA